MLAVVGEQPRLGIEGIDVRDAAAHEQEDDALRPGREVRRLGCERVGLAARPASSASNCDRMPGIRSEPATAERRKPRRRRSEDREL